MKNDIMLRKCLPIDKCINFMTSSKVLGSPSVESTGTLFVLVLVNSQFVSNERKKREEDRHNGL